MITDKERILSKIFTLLGGVFLVYGLILCIMSNLNLGVILVAVFGAFILCIGVFYQNIKKLTANSFFKVCRIVLILLASVELLLVSFIAIYGVYDDVDYTEDAVIVLGAGIRGDRVTLPLQYRLDQAVQYHFKNPEALIIVTGGKGFQETVTEAYAMEQYLIECGVDQNKIIKEEKATSTFENMKFSKEILAEHVTEDASVVVITNHFHIFRGVSIAKRAGFNNVSHMHAGLQWYNVMPCFLRESLAVMKMMLGW